MIENSISAPANFDPRKVEIIRKRFSVTQGETLVIYDGHRIEQYGDTPQRAADGSYRQKPDGYWIAVALREAVARRLIA
jgi:hypothetical protein